MINWKTRIKHPYFWVGAISSILTPVLAYMGLTIQDVTTWPEIIDILKHMVSNPYMLIVALGSLLTFLGVTNDPTTSSIGDSKLALTYKEPKKE